MSRRTIYPGTTKLRGPVCADKPRVSVVIPARNCHEQLATALRSLALSSHDDFETIVVNDASTDATPAVALAAGATVVDLPRQRGPAAARNAGVLAARGVHVVFLDADVCVHENTVSRLSGVLDSRPELAAVFGSYDKTPRAGNLISQYRNLVHHFVHQTSSESASTFWAGCGAVRRTVFLDIGGFDEGYTRPSVEDIELGVRMTKAGHRIMLDRSIHVTHLKRWDLWSILFTDVVYRGVPWSRLILREWSIPNDLNLKIGQRISAVLAAGLLAMFGVLTWQNPLMLFVPLVSLIILLALDAWSATRRIPDIVRAAGVVLAIMTVYAGMRASPLLVGASLLMVLLLMLINAASYVFFARERHPLFTLVVLPLHILFLWYSTLALSIGIVIHTFDALSGNGRLRRRSRLQRATLPRDAAGGLDGR